MSYLITGKIIIPCVDIVYEATIEIPYENLLFLGNKEKYYFMSQYEEDLTSLITPDGEYREKLYALEHQGEPSLAAFEDVLHEKRAFLEAFLSQLLALLNGTTIGLEWEAIIRKRFPEIVATAAENRN